MSAICFHCGKGSMYGRSHTHKRGVAGGRWKKRAQKTPRVFRVNLQFVWILDTTQSADQAKKRVKLCAKCLKRVKKDMTDGKKPFLKLAYPPSNLKSAEASKAN